MGRKKGITILDKTKPLSSKWTYEPVPDFSLFKHGEVERERYRERELQRWIEGHAGLTGMHYFALQECHYLLKNGSIIRPMWRDIDDLLFQDIDLSIKDGYMELVFKRRRFGLTSIGAGVAPHWFARTQKSSLCRLTSADQPRLDALFAEKLMISQNEFHPDIKGSVDSREGGTYRKGKEIGIALPSFDTHGRPTVKTSYISCRDTADTEDAAANFAGSGIIYAFIDEAALHKRLGTLLNSLEPALMTGFDREGFVLIGGSVEDTVKQSELLKLKELKNNAEIKNIRWFFVPGYMGMEGYMTNGHSDIKGATERILQKREQLDKLPDKKDLRAYIRSYPLEVDELFEMGGEGFWEEPSLDIMNEVTKDLSEKKIFATPSKLIRMGEDLRVKAVPESPILILEHPKPNVKYIFGVDSIGTGSGKKPKLYTQTDKDEKSLFGLVNMKQLDMENENSTEVKTSYTPILTYLDLPSKIQDAYDIVRDLVIYYNQYGSPHNRMVSVMMEANMATSDHMGTYFESLGMDKFLMNRPDLSGKGNSNTSKLGTYVTVDVLDWQRKQANMIIQKYGYRYRMVNLVNELFLLGSKNTDLGSAYLAALVGMGNKFDLPPPPPPPPPIKYRMEMLRAADGSTIKKMVEVRSRTQMAPEAPQFIEFMGIRTPIVPRKD